MRRKEGEVSRERYVERGIRRERCSVENRLTGNDIESNGAM